MREWKWSGSYDYKCNVDFKETDQGRVQTKITYSRDSKVDIKRCSEEFKKCTNLTHILGGLSI